MSAEMVSAAIVAVSGVILAWLKHDTTKNTRDIEELKRNVCFRNPCNDRISLK